MSISMKGMSPVASILMAVILLAIAISTFFLLPLALAKLVPGSPIVTSIVAILIWLVMAIYTFDQITKRLALPEDYRKVVRFGNKFEVLQKKYFWDEKRVILMIRIWSSESHVASETREVAMPKALGEDLVPGSWYVAEGDGFRPAK